MRVRLVPNDGHGRDQQRQPLAAARVPVIERDGDKLVLDLTGRRFTVDTWGGIRLHTESLVKIARKRRAFPGVGWTGTVFH